MEGPPDEPAAKRRKVRKGTRSCWECRRRKVKCIFASPEDAVCIMCDRRNAQCVSQVLPTRPVTEDTDAEPGGNSEDPDGRSVESSSKAQPRTRNGIAGYVPLQCSATPTTPVLTPESSSKKVVSGRIHAPRQTGRSSNQPLTPNLLPTPTGDDHALSAEETNHSTTVQILLDALPCQKDIKILLGKMSKISTFAYQSNFKSHSAGPTTMPPEQISVANLLRPERHPVLLGRQMLLFAASLQNLPPDKVFPGLTEHYRVIMERLAEMAIRMATTNDVLLSTLEGLENIILESFYHIDSGNIRRAWVTARRAVSAAQLLGLDRPGHYRYKLISDQTSLDPEVMWACIVSMERMLSLLLGLPTSTGAVGFTIHGVGAQDLSTLIYGATAKIIERNQINDRQKNLEMTREIDRELVKVTENLPSATWRPLVFAGLEIDSAEALWETRRAWEQMCYYTLVNQLHLPYMLCQDDPSSSSQTIYSRMACVNASREILGREVTLRTFNPVTACYRMGDFMTLIAGMTLMLAHVVSHCNRDGGGGGNLLAHQRLGNRATVERALECMRNMSELRRDVLAAKCVSLLRGLLTLEAEAARGRVCRIQRQDWAGEGARGRDDVMVIKVPYVGAVKIVLERDACGVASEPRGDECPLESVTIGGLGSVQLKAPKEQSRGVGDGAAGPAADQVDVSTQQDPQHRAQATYLDPLMQRDQLFPDAAAGIDDWVLQGFDTAFFDALLGGAGDLETHGAGGEGWDASGTFT